MRIPCSRSLKLIRARSDRAIPGLTGALLPQGPLELDAGMFLATISRLGMVYESLAGEAARAEKSFLSGIAGLLDEHALTWHRAAALLRVTEKYVAHQQGDRRVRAHPLLH